MRLFGITHPNELTQKKVRYFANYYAFAINQLGKSAEFELENFHSLIDKIIFQMENNPTTKSIPYIESYLNHPLLSPTNKYFREIKRASEVSTVFAAFLNESNSGKKAWVCNGSNLLKLKRFRTYLRKYMLKNAVKAIISFLACEHELGEHKDDLRFFTRLVAVELFYSQPDRKELVNIISRIMSRDIKVFPFCPVFLKRNKGNIEKAKEKFLENRTFVQQFEGIRSAFRENPMKKFFIFRVGNIEADSDFQFDFEEVRLISKDSSRIQSVKRIFFEKGFDDPNFFENSFGMYAIVEHLTKGPVSFSAKGAQKKVLDAIGHVNQVCGTSGCVDKSSFLYTDDFVNIGGSVSLLGQIRKLDPIQVHKLRISNLSGYLRTKKIKAKKRFQEIEKIYLGATKSGKIDDYWRYLEAIMGGQPFKEKVVQIVAPKLYQTEEAQLKAYLLSCFSLFNVNPTVLGTTPEKQKEIFYRIRTEEDFDLGLIRSEIDNEFVIDLCNLISDLKSSDRQLYVRGIINEVQEQRNLIQHSGKVGTKSELKLLESLPSILHAFRAEVINQMRQNPKLELNEIIKLMVQ